MNSAVRASLKTMQVQAPGASTLTDAELRLLPHLATHLSFREIGERQFLSRHTVKSHAMAIYRKLNFTSRNAAVERARELGLL
jgi:LuxR family maltose regulon positive regulatory protein